MSGLDDEITYFSDPRLKPIDALADTKGSMLTGAKNGDPIAMLLLGLSILNNPQGQPDYVSAAKWLSMSAERGIPAAMANLAILYLKGRGVRQDYVFAYMWISKSVTSGLIEAISLRDEMASRLSSVELADAGELAKR